MYRTRFLCVAPLLFSVCVFAQAPDADAIAFFEKNVRPLLASRCYGCHSSKLSQPMSGLRLDTRAGVLRGGASGSPAVVPGKPDESLLIMAVRRSHPTVKMPPDGPLASSEIDALVQWVKMGAPDPRTETNPAVPDYGNYDWDKARRHWAFRPVEDPKPPRVASVEWSRSAIDKFVKAKLDENGLKPLARAAKQVLIRRATYDLTGLPPTPQEVDRFLADDSSAAFQKVVDRLLASQQYGERWGRHWLDVVRYADTSGDNSDFPVPAMYRYRNWVIQSFNADKPYDQFLREQIAGDLLPAGNSEDRQQKVIATGYLANSRRFGSRIKEFHLTIDDTIDNLGRGMLALSVSCARCHNHKFDPIPNTDYYALYGIFKSTDYAHAGTEIYPHTYGFAALGSAEDAAKLKSFETDLSWVDNRIEDLKSGKVKGLSKEQMREAQQEVQAKLRKLSAEYPYLPKAYAVAEGTAGDAKILIKGDPAALGPEVPRGFLTILGGQKLPAEEKRSGRMELAGWIADPKNPLTARVMVNRIWQGHFGQGLVATPNDFGTRGEAPSHPELLDYLASRFVEGGWSIKKMHRLIMLSRTYQMSSGPDLRNAVKDPKDAYLWKFSRRRLEAEEIRDSLLAVSGKLDPAMGGEHPFAAEMEWKYTQHKPFVASYESNKRSVYLMQQRIRHQPFLELFDGPDPNAITGLRPVTTTALQALFTMNDPFFHEQADMLAVRVGMAYGSELSRLNYAYKLVYGRGPSANEVEENHQFLVRARRALEGTDVEEDRRNREAWAGLMRVLLASNEFLTLD